MGNMLLDFGKAERGSLEVNTAEEAAARVVAGGEQTACASGVEYELCYFLVGCCRGCAGKEEAFRIHGQENHVGIAETGERNVCGKHLRHGYGEFNQSGRGIELEVNYHITKIAPSCDSREFHFLEVIGVIFGISRDGACVRASCGGRLPCTHEF